MILPFKSTLGARQTLFLFKANYFTSLFTTLILLNLVLLEVRITVVPYLISDINLLNAFLPHLDFLLQVVVLGCVLAASAAPGSLLYPVLPAAPHGYLVRTYAAAAPAVPVAPVAPVAHYAHVPTSYSHVSHTQYTSHPVPLVHSPLLYHAPAALVV